MTAPIPLEPVDGVTVHTIVDNVSDALLANRGPARRTRGNSTSPRALTVEGLGPDALKAEHGFSALIELATEHGRRQILFDTGVSEEGAAENLRRLELPVADIEAIVLSHGHYDHTMGLHGLASELGRRNLPIVLHPEAWSRRRLLIEGREPLELPTLSGSALRGAGFEVVEEERPSFLLDGRLLITGEVDRTTAYETGMRRQEALHEGVWSADPLIRDDQAIVLHVRDRGLVILTGCGHAGNHQHRAARAPADGRGPSLRGDGRLPPARRRRGGGDPPDLHGAGGVRAGGHRAGALHGLASCAPAGAAVPGCVHSQRRGHALRVVGVQSGVS